MKLGRIFGSVIGRPFIRHSSSRTFRCAVTIITFIRYPPVVFSVITRVVRPGKRTRLRRTVVSRRNTCRHPVLVADMAITRNMTWNRCVVGRSVLIAACRRPKNAALLSGTEIPCIGLRLRIIASRDVRRDLSHFVGRHLDRRCLVKHRLSRLLLSSPKRNLCVC